jgi:hypothetical protein
MSAFWIGFAAPWVVWVGLPFVLWRAAKSLAGLRVLRRVLPGKWASRRIATGFLLGPAFVAGVAVAIATSPGEGVAVFALDLVLLCVVGGVVSSLGLIRGRVDFTMTKTPLPPNPWRLLSFRDRFRVRRCVRTGVMLDDERFAIAAGEWVDDVLDKPEFASPSQRRRAEAMSGLMRSTNLTAGHEASVASDATPA